AWSACPSSRPFRAECENSASCASAEPMAPRHRARNKKAPPARYAQSAGGAQKREHECLQSPPRQLKRRANSEAEENVFPNCGNLFAGKVITNGSFSGKCQCKPLDSVARGA